MCTLHKLEDQNNLTDGGKIVLALCGAAHPFWRKTVDTPWLVRGAMLPSEVRVHVWKALMTSPPVTFGEQRVLLVVFARLLSRDWSAIFIRQLLPSRERERERGIGVDICCCAALQHYAMLIHSTHTHSANALGRAAWHQKREKRAAFPS